MRLSLVQYVQLPENGGWLLRKSRAPVQTLENLEMKKTLVAIAALAAFGAQAQSSVAITGGFDAGYQALSNNVDGTKNFRGVTNNGTYTSRLDFQGVEDLGGGTKASFWGEFDVNPVRSTTTNQAVANDAATWNGTGFSGQQYVGLAGAFGDLKIGAPNSAAMASFNANAHPFGTALGGGWSGGAIGRLGSTGVSGLNQFVGAASNAGRIVRNEKTVKYDTPVFSGFKAEIEYSVSNGRSATVTSNDNNYQSIALDYNQGPLNVAYVNASAKAGNTAAAVTGANTGTAPVAAANSSAGLLANQKVSWNMLSANYNLGATTVYAGYSTTKSDDATTGAAAEDSKASNIAVKYALNGKVDLLGNYLKRTNMAGLTTVAASNKLIGLGADYKLSKMTTAYARYESMDGLVSSTAPQKQTTTMVGLRVNF
jgi:predicted porin